MKRNLMLLAACAGVGLAAPARLPAYAQTPSEYSLSAVAPPQNDAEWGRFIEYNIYREPCQNYVPPPAGYVMRGCHVYRIEQPVAEQTTVQTTEEMVQAAPPETQEQQTVYFDFDKSNIRADERQHVADIARQLREANITEATVDAHTDTSGPQDYNQALSERRASAVVQALATEGVNASILEPHAYGETRPAVALGDGVKSQENRRAVISYQH